MLSADGSTRAVWMALAGNSFLTVVKFVAFGLSGSGAMFSEAIHSLADAGNQALLAVGIRRSERPPDAAFPYGFGGERYLFALLSAVGIFVLGCGVTVYHGVHVLLHPGPLQIGWYVYAVLGVSFVVDGFVLWQALATVHRLRGDEPLLAYLRGTSDPMAAAVLLEDGVACLGVLVALAGIGLSAASGSTLPDAVATLLIGLMMGGVALWLGLRNRALIVGQAIPSAVQAQILAFLREQPTIERVRDVRSRVVGAGTYRFKADVDFNGAVLAERFTPWVERRAGELHTPEARAAFTRAFGEKLARALGEETDRIEAELRRRFPELKYLDLESD